MPDLDLDQTPQPPLPRTLGDGLILRRATAADAEALADLNGRLHAAPYDEVAAAWTRELFNPEHPAGVHERILVVEDTGSAALVSTTCLIPQTWSYGGVAFPAGRPELVGTAPEYRRRGLIREIFSVIHAWATAEGQLLQFITGIPNYYRQFGYAPAIEVAGVRAEARAIPALPDGEVEPVRFRPATAEDIPDITRLGNQPEARSLVTCVRDEANWRYEVFGRQPGSDYVHTFEVAETPAGEIAGVIAYPPYLERGALQTGLFEVAPDRSWRPIGLAMLRRLRAVGQSLGNDADPCTWIGITGGLDHPVCEAFPSLMTPRKHGFELYVRIGDLPAFLRHVGSVLEARLTASALIGHTGKLRLNFYRSGVELSFLEGRLAEVTTWQPSTADYGDAMFPDLTFLHLLLGHRSLEELEHAYADCSGRGDEPRALLGILFPKAPSVMWPVG